MIAEDAKRLGVVVVKRNAPVGVSADPPRPQATADRGVFCLSHLGSRVGRGADRAGSSSETTHSAPNRIEFAISGIRPTP